MLCVIAASSPSNLTFRLCLEGAIACPKTRSESYSKASICLAKWPQWHVQFIKVNVPVIIQVTCSLSLCLCQLGAVNTHPTHCCWTGWPQMTSEIVGISSCSEKIKQILLIIHNDEYWKLHFLLLVSSIYSHENMWISSISVFFLSGAEER